MAKKSKPAKRKAAKKAVRKVVKKAPAKKAKVFGKPLEKVSVDQLLKKAYREAYFMKKPCITLRDETEWTETVRVGRNTLVGVDVDLILHTWKTFSPPAEQPPIFGDGTAGEKIAKILSETKFI